MRIRCLNLCAVGRLAGVLMLLLAIAIGCKVRRFDAQTESSSGNSTSEDSPLTYGEYFEACKEALGTPPQITCHFPDGNKFSDDKANPQYQIPAIFDRDGKLHEEANDPWDLERGYVTRCANFRENEGQSSPSSCGRYTVYSLYQGDKKGSLWGVLCGQDDKGYMQNERYSHIQVIGYNSDTGKTCFWASKRFKELKEEFAIDAKKIASITPNGESGELLPPPEGKESPVGDPDAPPEVKPKVLRPMDFWQSPEELVRTETGCVQCHQRGPWVSSNNLRWAHFALSQRQRQLELEKKFPQSKYLTIPETYKGKLGSFSFSQVPRLFPKNPDKYSVVLHDKILQRAQIASKEQMVHPYRAYQWQRYAYRLPSDRDQAKAALKAAKFHPALAECSKCHSLVKWEQDIIQQAIRQHFDGYFETGLTEQSAPEIWDYFKSPNNRAYHEIRGLHSVCEKVEGCEQYKP